MKEILKQNYLILLSLLLIVIAAIGLFMQLKPEDTRVIPRIRGVHSGVLILESPERAQVNQPFTLTIKADTKKSKVNAVGLYLNYEPKKLQIVDMRTTSSFCQFYPERRFDNNLGTVSLACGSPHPGFSGSDDLLVISFMPKSVGTTTIRVAPKSQLLLSDGKGTDILTEYPQLPITINSGL